MFHIIIRLYTVSKISSILTDVCTKFDNLCSQICEATDESYICKCEKGYKLDGDKKTCILEDSESVTEKSNEVPINSTEYE